ncbi:hypothetical protein V8J88_00540 [Massilia sp. W12]|uniref:hypothetical protein n=1 Tax=Massilia sp. W12 TaxID=3126507 RepID=UPI0030D08FA7
MYFSAALLLIAFILFAGYRELRKQPHPINGVSTWLFAIPPFLGLLLKVSTNEDLPLMVRGLTVGALCVLALVVCCVLYQLAREAQNEGNPS